MLTVHMGQPKSYSTYIQQYFSELEQAGDILYCGMRPGNSIDKWFRSTEEQRLLDRLLRYDSKQSFRAELANIRQFCNRLVVEASQGNQDLILSAENLSMRVLPGELDVEEKLARLELLFPLPKSYVCVFRNVKQAVISLYKELCNLGYGLPFTAFLDEAYSLKESNFINSLLPHQLLDMMSHSVAEQNNITFVFTNNTPDFDLNVFGEQPNSDEIRRPINAGLSFAHAQALANLNSQTGVSSGLSSLSELHRMNWQSALRDEQSVWYKRRQIKSNIEKVQQLLLNDKGSNDEATEIYLQSTLSSYVNSELKKLAENDQLLKKVKVIGQLEYLT